MRLLHISPRVPFPPTDGGAIGIYNIVTGAAKAGNEVHLLSINTPKHFQKGKVIPHIAEESAVLVNTNISPVKAFLNLFKSIPYIAERFISQEFSDKLAHILQTTTFDAIQFESVFVAPYIEVVRKYSKAPVVVRAHNVEYVIWDRVASNTGNPLKRRYFKLLADRLRNFESKYYNLFDGVAAITEEDVKRLRELNVNVPVEIIPAGVDLDAFDLKAYGKPKPDSIFILSSLDWIPNQEAVLWFVKNVWPVVSETNKNLTLHIAGKNTPSHIQELSSDRIKVHGFVDDAKKFMSSYDLMAVPLLSGGGMRVKIIEGLAMAKPILTTTIGGEGIKYTKDLNMLVADSPEEWIKTIEVFFRDRSKFFGLEMNGRKLAEDVYSNVGVTNNYIDFYKKLIFKK